MNTTDWSIKVLTEVINSGCKKWLDDHEVDGLTEDLDKIAEKLTPCSWEYAGHCVFFDGKEIEGIYKQFVHSRCLPVLG